MAQEGAASVLVTLVRTQGSSYRRPGARLLLGARGGYAGTLSGGCLEAEVVRKATWLIHKGAVVQRYSTMFDDTAEIPFGLGCGGIVDLLLEPTSTPEFRALLAALERSLTGEESIVLTWLPNEERELARTVLSAQGDLLFSSDSLTEKTLANVKTCVVSGIGELPQEIFVERVVAPQRIFIVGAGDDAKPLVSIAALLGWTVKVVDGRSQLAKVSRFPEAESVSVIQSAALASGEVKRNDAVVIMTHSYDQDRDWLAAMLPLRPAYIGMLGARHRTSFLISDVASELGLTVAECCGLIQAPVGLNLGGDGPEVIALAIIAEIQASRTGMLANSRKLTPMDVESYVKQGGSASLYASSAMDSTCSA
jgi:xanthine dehydrogenase accessory factor